MAKGWGNFRDYCSMPSMGKANPATLSRFSLFFPIPGGAKYLAMLTMLTMFLS
jgi:hypothetical protein